MGLLVALYIALGIQFGNTDLKNQTKPGENQKEIINISNDPNDTRPGEGGGW